MSADAPTPPPAVPGEAAAEPVVRVARLRAEYAEQYPGLDAGAWYPAASLAAYYRAWLVRHPDRGRSGAPLRGLDTDHFEFRGGVPREEPWIRGRSPDDRHSAEP
jgi:hypothetical protein